MPKIIFIQPPWAEVYGNFHHAAKVGNAYPPLGICYLAAIAREKGFAVRIIDAEMEGKGIADCVRETAAYQPDLICLSSTTPIYHLTLRLAQELKKQLDTPILCGGAHVTVMPEMSVQGHPEIDYAIYGEGEITFREFLEYQFESREGPENIHGLIWRDAEGAIKLNQPRSLISDLDSLPLPERGCLDLDKYQWSVPGKGMVRFTTIMTSRGCPFSCIFCSCHTVFGKRVRLRAISKVLDELEQLVKEFNISHFAFIDDTLTMNHERVRELCSGIRERQLQITWEGWTRANTVDAEILKVMRDAGFVRISFGIESGNPEILAGLKKGVKLEDYKKAYAAAAAAEIETRGSVMLGHPNETRRTAMDTLKFIRKLKHCQQMYINIVTPYPGTELYQLAHDSQAGMKLLTSDFSQYKRYGNAVVEVNDLSVDDLVKLQKRGFRMFYFTPRRILYNIRRAGLRAAFRNARAFFLSVIWSTPRS